MAKIRIATPQKFIFSTEIPIRINDINYGRHLGHDSVLSLTHEARIRFLKAYGYSEYSIEGAGVIMADVAITYASEAFYGNILKINIGVGDFGSRFFELIYLLENKSRSNEEVAKVKTSLVFFDYEKRKTIPMPEIFRKKIIGTQTQR